jgi:hypothetical protein
VCSLTSFQTLCLSSHERTSGANLAKQSRPDAKLMDVVRMLQMMVGPFRKDITLAQKRKRQSGTYTMFPRNSTELEVPFWRELASVFDSPDLRLAFLSKFQAVLDIRLEKYRLRRPARSALPHPCNPSTRAGVWLAFYGPPVTSPFHPAEFSHPRGV